MFELDIYYSLLPFNKKAVIKMNTLSLPPPSVESSVRECSPPEHLPLLLPAHQKLYIKHTVGIMIKTLDL